MQGPREGYLSPAQSRREQIGHVQGAAPELEADHGLE